MGSDLSFPDYIGARKCKEIVGEERFDQEKFNAIKGRSGKITKQQMLDLVLADTLEFNPAGSRNEDIRAQWENTTKAWRKVPKLTMPIVEKFRNSASLLDQAPAENLNSCVFEENEVAGNFVLVCVPKTLVGVDRRRPVQIFFHGGGFVMGRPQHFRRTCAKLAVLSKSVIVCPTVGNAPEDKADTWLRNAYAAFKWVNNEADQLNVDVSRIVVRGENHGAFIALKVAAQAIKKNEHEFIKFIWLDVPALLHDFLPKWRDPDKEIDEMHQISSKLNLQTFSLLFTDIEKQEEFNWDEHKNDVDIFPAFMEEELLKKIPPILLTTGEFDHVGRRACEQFAERLKGIEGKLLGCYIQPGVGHNLYGADQSLRDKAEKIFYTIFM